MSGRQQEAAMIAQVRQRLESQEGQPLPAGRVVVGTRDDGGQRQHRFDLVADDRSVVGEIRTYTLGEGGGRPAGKFAHCYAACLFLFRTRARRKLLVLTDQAFWSRFRRESEGVVAGIEILYVPSDVNAPILDTVPAVESVSAAALAPRPTRPFAPADRIPITRRNKGGPGPRGRHPNTGQRRGK